MRALLQFVRGLRFRLTLANSVFMAALLIATGFFFRGVLRTELDDQIRELLNEEWGAVKGYLVIHKSEANWMFDAEDQEERLIVEQLRRVFLLADNAGKVLDYSALYEDIGVNSADEIRAALATNQPYWAERVSTEGEPFLIRGGLFVDDNGQRFFVAIGRSLARNRRTLHDFTRAYLFLLPGFILAGSLVSWFVAGRAVSPVHRLAQTAERISSSNLSLRIPPRKSGDELDHLIHTFNHMMERLERSFVMTRQFSTDVSHELRTPLTAIRGQLEVALFTANTKEQYREAMVNALEDVERLSQTIRAMLLLSQAESGQLELQRTVLDLAPIVEDIVDQFQIPAEECELTLRGEIAGHAYVDGDRIQLERLISNLLSNAVKYTPAGGSITVRVGERDGQVVVEVEDTGLGIKPDHLPHIFDRFYRVPGTSKEKQGLGLGLSFVAWIVKAHQGTIDVQSEPGKGTRFRIAIPMAPSPAAVEAAAALEPASTSNPAV